jgi:enoyl-CoA hydratase
MSYQNILLDILEPGIYLLTINRPQALNALNSAALDEIDDAVQKVGTDANARMLLLTGAGEKAFVAGADITEMQNYTPMQAKALSEKALPIFHGLENLPLPVIALVNGYCFGGGCELALSCDFILASERAVFGQPEINLGIMAGFGGSQRLPRLVGRAMALELLLTGRQVKADEAKQIGLVNHVYPAEELRAKGFELARLIASKGPVAVRLTKQAVQHGQDLDLIKACALESDLFALTFTTADQKEGMSAFLEKRPARFQGK